MPPIRPDRPIIVAAHSDMLFCAGRPIAYVEHGAGQTYDRPVRGYADGRERGPVGLFLATTERVGRLARELYPTAEVAVVGPARLDPWLRGRCGDRLCPCQDGDPCHYEDHPGTPAMTRTNHDDPLVALAWHWPGSRPEAGSAWLTFQTGLGDLSRTHRLLGHAHPRMMATCRPVYERLGIEVVETSDEIFDRADVLCVDNSSIGWEALAIGLGIVWLNSPAYRKDLDIGLRFWDDATASGPLVDTIAEWPAAITEAAAGDAYSAKQRRGVAERVWSHLDGRSGQRAADALVAWVATEPEPRSRVAASPRG